MEHTKVENDLAKVLYTISDREKEKLDESCKRLLSFKSVLAWILKTCVKEFHACSIQEIEQKYIIGTPVISRQALHRDEIMRDDTMQEAQGEGASRIAGARNEDESILEGTVTFDIKFDVYSPLRENEVVTMIINIESQGDFYPGYPIVKRGIYYGGRLISSQYGTVFTKSHYEKLEKVYTIWICLNAPDYRKNTLNLYSFHETQMIGSFAEDDRNYDLITVAMICIGNEADENCTGLLRMLAVLLSSEMDVIEKKQRLEQEFGIEMTTKMEREATEMCDYSKMVEDRGIAKGLEQGLEQGLKQGVEQGLRQGVEQGILGSVRMLEEMHLSKEDIITKLEATFRLSHEEAKRYLA